jgi:hypothetical protein
MPAILVAQRPLNLRLMICYVFFLSTEIAEGTLSPPLGVPDFFKKKLSHPQVFYTIGSLTRDLEMGGKHMYYN